MMASKERMPGPPGIVRWNASYWLVSSLCEKQYRCHFLTGSHISSILRQFSSCLVQLIKLVAHLVGVMATLSVDSRKSPQAAGRPKRLDKLFCFYPKKGLFFG